MNETKEYTNLDKAEPPRPVTGQMNFTPTPGVVVKVQSRART